MEVRFMYSSAEEILSYVRDNDVKFIRLAFCDIFGTQKNIAIQPSELPRAFESGISFDASAISGFMNIEESDLLLVPDPDTVAILPWRPAHGRVIRLFCDIVRPDGTPFEGDCRRLLRETARRAMQRGYVCKFGPEFCLQINAQESGVPKPILRCAGEELPLCFPRGPAEKGQFATKTTDLCLYDIVPPCHCQAKNHFHAKN